MLDFKNATLLSYNHRNNFGGGEAFRLGSSKEITVRGLLKSKTQNQDLQGVKESQIKIKDYIDTANDWEDITINDHNFGKGRVTSLEFEAGSELFIDHIRFAEFKVTVEIPDSTNQDSLYNLRGETYRGVLSAVDRTSSALEAFDENFDFNIAEDNTFSYSHDLTINFISGVEPQMVPSGARYASNYYFLKNLESDEEYQFARSAYEESLRRIDTSADIISSNGKFSPPSTAALDIAQTDRIGSIAVSSTHADQGENTFVANNAIDGSTSTDFVALNYGGDATQWWEIDLGCNVYDLTKIQIEPRASATAQAFFNNFRISVFEEGYTRGHSSAQNVGAAELATSYAKYLIYGSDHYDTDATYPTSAFTINLPVGVYGRYVRVQFIGNKLGSGATRNDLGSLGFSEFKLYSSRSIVKVYNSTAPDTSLVVASVKHIKANPIEQSKKAARRIFEARPALGFIDAKYSGYYQTTGKSLFTETYDLANHTCSFSKTVNFLPNTGDKYSVARSHSFRIDERGVSELTEDGTVKGRIRPFFSSAREGAETEIAGSYSRITGIYSGYCALHNISSNVWSLPYKSGLNHGPSGIYIDIFDRPINITRTYSSGEAEVSYSVSYSNDPRITGEYQLERSISLAKNTQNIFTVTENGTITPYFTKRFNFTQANPDNADDPYGLKSFYKQKEHKIKKRCERAYSQYVNRLDYGGLLLTPSWQYDANKVLTLNPVSTRISHAAYGKSLTYTKSFSDDRTLFVEANSGLKTFRLSFSDNVPAYLSREYVIPNRNYTFVQKGNYSSLGSRTVSCEGTITRDASNILNIYDGSEYVTSNLLDANLHSSIQYMTAKCYQKAHNVWSDYRIDTNEFSEIYISSHSYRFGSDRKLSMDVTFTFASHKGSSKLAFKDGGQ